MPGCFKVQALPETAFGAEVRFHADLPTSVEALESEPDPLLQAFYQADGLLVLKGVRQITEEPELLVRLSRLLGRKWRTITRP